MALSVQNNIAALNSYRNLSATQNNLSSSLEKLSSGYRINRAADDAAGLAISEGLRSQIGGLKVAVRNAQDGISVVQTAEGALNETTSILQRMRDLSVQAGNDGGLSADAKGNIQSEMDQLKSELTRIADTTSFNGANLLDGTYNGTFQVGANAGQTISFAVGTSMSAVGLGVDGINVREGVDAAFGTTNAVALAAGTGGDGDVAESLTIDGTAYEIRAALGTGDAAAMTTQDIADAINANTTAQADGVSASVNDAGGLTITKSGIDGALAVTGTAGFTLTADAGEAVSGVAAGDSDQAINLLDAAIKTVSTTRADLGAVQNRFDHTIANLNVAVENLTASESRIRDTDMASEMVNFTSQQILSQAGTAMLAQAKSIPQGVLSLLQ